MALAAAIIWEVQTGGSDSNGGGFKAGASGTDRSQQAAAQVAIDNATITTSIATNVITFTGGYSPSSADVGNVVQMLTGTNVTAGFYEITSVVAGTSWTVDRNVVTSGTTTNATGNMGGCLASPGQAAGAKVAGNGVWIKAGTYTISVTTPNVATGIISDSQADGGTGFWEGYQTTRGDLGTAPVLQVASSGVTSVTVFAKSAAGFIRNLTVDGQSKSSIRGWSVATYGGIACIGLTGMNCTNAAFVGAAGNYFERCVATGCSVQSTAWFTGGTHVACVSYGNTTAGYWVNDTSTFVRCISSGNSGASSDGWDTRNFPSTFAHCVSYGNGRHGFNQTNTALVEWLNCIAEANGGYGYTGNVTPNTGLLRYCAGYNNTSGAYDTAVIVRVVGFVTLTASPFTNAASGDFSLNTTAGGGSSCRAAGYPGVFPNGTTTGYVDIGAAQHADPAALALYAVE